VLGGPARARSVLVNNIRFFRVGGPLSGPVRFWSTTSAFSVLGGVAFISTARRSGRVGAQPTGDSRPSQPRLPRHKLATPHEGHNGESEEQPPADPAQFPPLPSHCPLTTAHFCPATDHFLPAYLTSLPSSATLGVIDHLNRGHQCIRAGPFGGKQWTGGRQSGPAIGRRTPPSPARGRGPG
jgi:hypothetical protein